MHKPTKRKCSWWKNSVKSIHNIQAKNFPSTSRIKLSSFNTPPPNLTSRTSSKENPKMILSTWPMRTFRTMNYPTSTTNYNMLKTTHSPMSISKTLNPSSKYKNYKITPSITLSLPPPYHTTLSFKLSRSIASICSSPSLYSQPKPKYNSLLRSWLEAILHVSSNNVLRYMMNWPISTSLNLSSFWKSFNHVMCFIATSVSKISSFMKLAILEF